MTSHGCNFQVKYMKQTLCLNKDDGKPDKYQSLCKLTINVAYDTRNVDLLLFAF